MILNTNMFKKKKIITLLKKFVTAIFFKLNQIIILFFRLI